MSVKTWFHNLFKGDGYKSSTSSSGTGTSASAAATKDYTSSYSGNTTTTSPQTSYQGYTDYYKSAPKYTGIVSYDTGKKTYAQDIGTTISDSEFRNQYKLARSSGVSDEDFYKDFGNGVRWADADQPVVSSYETGKKTYQQDIGNSVSEDEFREQYRIARNNGVSEDDFYKLFGNGTRWQEQSFDDWYDEYTAQQASTQSVADNSAEGGSLIDQKAIDDDSTFLERFRSFFTDSDLGNTIAANRLEHLTEKYGDKVFDDDFRGQFNANFATSNIYQEFAMAWSDYMDNPTEENRQYALDWGELYEKVVANNEAALDDINVKYSWLSQNLAQQVPQTFNQIKRSVPYMISLGFLRAKQGAAVGGTAGAAAGSVVPGAGTAAGAGVGSTAGGFVGLMKGIGQGNLIGSTLYGYDITNGAAFYDLMQEGADEVTAKDFARDEAFISTVIEGGENIMDYFLMFGSKIPGVKDVLGKMSEKSLSALLKNTSKLTQALTSYAADVGGEYSEEFLQEIVSAANARRLEKMQNGEDYEEGIDGLMSECMALVNDMITGKASDTLQSAHEAGKGGAIVGIITGAGRTGYSHVTNRISNTVVSNNIKNVTNPDVDLTDEKEYDSAYLRSLRSAAESAEFKNEDAVKRIDEELKRREEAQKTSKQTTATEEDVDIEEDEEAHPLGYEAAERAKQFADLSDEETQSMSVEVLQEGYEAAQQAGDETTAQKIEEELKTRGVKATGTTATASAKADVEAQAKILSTLSDETLNAMRAGKSIDETGLTEQQVEALREAGLIETYTGKDGNTYDYIHASDVLWDEIAKRYAKQHNTAGTSQKQQENDFIEALKRNPNRTPAENKFLESLGYTTNNTEDNNVSAKVQTEESTGSASETERGRNNDNSSQPAVTVDKNNSDNESGRLEEAGRKSSEAGSGRTEGNQGGANEAAPAPRPRKRVRLSIGGNNKISNGVMAHFKTSGVFAQVLKEIENHKKQRNFITDILEKSGLSKKEIASLIQARKSVAAFNAGEDDAGLVPEITNFEFYLGGALEEENVRPQDIAAVEDSFYLLDMLSAFCDDSEVSTADSKAFLYYAFGINEEEAEALLERIRDRADAELTLNRILKEYTEAELESIKTARQSGKDNKTSVIQEGNNITADDIISGDKIALPHSKFKFNEKTDRKVGGKRLQGVTVYARQTGKGVDDIVFLTVKHGKVLDTFETYNDAMSSLNARRFGYRMAKFVVSPDGNFYSFDDKSGEMVLNVENTFGNIDNDKNMLLTVERSEASDFANVSYSKVRADQNLTTNILALDLSGFIHNRGENVSVYDARTQLTDFMNLLLKGDPRLGGKKGRPGLTVKGKDGKSKHYVFAGQTANQRKHGVVYLMEENAYNAMRKATCGGLTDEQIGAVNPAKYLANFGYVFTPANNDLGIKQNRMAVINDPVALFRAANRGYVLMAAQDSENLADLKDPNAVKDRKEIIESLKKQGMSQEEAEAKAAEMLNGKQAGAVINLLGDLQKMATDGLMFINAKDGSRQVRGTAGVKGLAVGWLFKDYLNNAIPVNPNQVFVYYDEDGNIIGGFRHRSEAEGVEVLDAWAKTTTEGHWHNLKDIDALAFTSTVKFWDKYASQQDFWTRSKEFELHSLFRENVYGNEDKQSSGVIMGYRKYNLTQALRKVYGLTNEEIEGIVGEYGYKPIASVLTGKAGEALPKMFGVDPSYNVPPNSDDYKAWVIYQTKGQVLKTNLGHRWIAAKLNAVANDVRAGGFYFKEGSAHYQWVSPDVAGVIKLMTSYTIQKESGNISLTEDKEKASPTAKGGLALLCDIKNSRQFSVLKPGEIYDANLGHTGATIVSRSPSAEINDLQIRQNVAGKGKGSNRLYDVLIKEYGLDKDVTYLAVGDSIIFNLDNDFDGDTVFTAKGVLADTLAALNARRDEAQKGASYLFTDFNHGQGKKDSNVSMADAASASSAIENVVINSMYADPIGTFDIYLDQLYAISDDELQKFIDYAKGEDVEDIFKGIPTDSPMELRQYLAALFSTAYKLNFDYAKYMFYPTAFRNAVGAKDMLYGIDTMKDQEAIKQKSDLYARSATGILGKILELNGYAADAVPEYYQFLKGKVSKSDKAELRAVWDKKHMREGKQILSSGNDLLSIIGAKAKNVTQPTDMPRAEYSLEEMMALYGGQTTENMLEMDENASYKTFVNWMNNHLPQRKNSRGEKVGVFQVAATPIDLRNFASHSPNAYWYVNEETAQHFVLLFDNIVTSQYNSHDTKMKQLYLLQKKLGMNADQFLSFAINMFYKADPKWERHPLRSQKFNMLLSFNQKSIDPSFEGESTSEIFVRNISALSAASELKTAHDIFVEQYNSIYKKLEDNISEIEESFGEAMSHIDYDAESVLATVKFAVDDLVKAFRGQRDMVMGFKAAVDDAERVTKFSNLYLKANALKNLLEIYGDSGLYIDNKQRLAIIERLENFISLADGIQQYPASYAEALKNFYEMSAEVAEQFAVAKDSLGEYYEMADSQSTGLERFVLDNDDPENGIYDKNSLQKFLMDFEKDKEYRAISHEDYLEKEKRFNPEPDRKPTYAENQKSREEIRAFVKGLERGTYKPSKADLQRVYIEADKLDMGREKAILSKLISRALDSDSVSQESSTAVNKLLEAIEARSNPPERNPSVKPFSGTPFPTNPSAQQKTASAPPAAKQNITIRSSAISGFEEGRLINETGMDLSVGKGSKLTQAQQVSLRVIDFLSKEIGGKIHFYSSVMKKDGKRYFAKDILDKKAGREAAAGFYDPSTGDIYLDIFNGNLNTGTMLYTLAHEYVHQIRQNSSEDYKILRDFVADKLGSEKMKALMDDRKSIEVYKSLTDSEIEEEVVAFSLQEMLTKSETMKEIVKLKETSPTLISKLHDLISRFRAQIVAAYHHLENLGLSDEAKAMRELKLSHDELEKLAKAFAHGVMAKSGNETENAQTTTANQKQKESFSNPANGQSEKTQTDYQAAWNNAEGRFGEGHKKVTAAAKKLMSVKYPGNPTAEESPEGYHIHKVYTDFVNAAVEVNDGISNIKRLAQAYDALRDTNLFSDAIYERLKNAAVEDDVHTSNPDTVDYSERLSDEVSQIIRSVAARAKNVFDNASDMESLDSDAVKATKAHETGKVGSFLLRWSASSPTIFKFITGYKKGSVGYKIAERIESSVLQREKILVDARNAFEKVRQHKDFDRLAANKDTIELKNLGGEKISIMDAIYLRRALSSVRVNRKTLSSVKGVFVNDKKVSIAEGANASELLWEISHELENCELHEIIGIYDDVLSEEFGKLGKLAKKVALKIDGYSPDFMSQVYYAPVHWLQGGAKLAPGSYDFEDFNGREASLKSEPSYVHSRKSTSGYLYSSSMSTVFDTYLANMSDYIAMKELRNYFEIASSTAKIRTSKTLAEIFGENYGTGFSKWIRNYTDLLTLNKESSESLMLNLRNRFQQGVLIGSPSVMMKQTSSYWAASGVISMRSLLLARGKRMSMRGVAKGMTSYDYRSYSGKSDITLAEASGADKKAFNAMMDSSKAFQLVKDGIGIFDRLTVNNLYIAACYDIWQQNPSLDVNSAEFKQKVEDLFNKAVMETQPMFEKELRPEYSRSENEFVRLLSMFRTQQSQNFSNLVTAIGENRTLGSKESRNHLKAVIAGQAASALSLAILSAVADLLLHNHKKYKDDDDEWDADIIFNRLAMSAVESAAGTFWFGDELAKVAIDMLSQGETSESYGLNLGPVTTIFNTVDSLKTLCSDFSLTNAKKTITYIAQLCGMPVGNAYRITNAAVMWYLDLTGRNDSNYDDVLKMLEKEYMSGDSDSHNAHVMINYELSGNSTKMNRFYDMLSDEGKTAVKHDIKERFIDGEISEKKAENLLLKFVEGDTEEAGDIMSEWQYQKDTGLDFDELAKNYKNGKISADEYIQAYTEVGGHTEEDARKNLVVMDFKADYPQMEKASYAFISKYEQYVAASGFSIQDYYDFYFYVNDLGAIDLNGDGKSDRQSFLVDVIDSMPISAEQKDALYASLWKTTTSAYSNRPWA